MYKLLLNANPDAKIDDLFYSPFHKDGIIEKYKTEHPSRKPDIGMILDAQKKYDLDLASSYMIGDAYTDIKCGVNARTKNILVETGYGKIAYKKCLDENLKIDFIASNLLEAVKYIEKLN
jgi:histidinol phosphatase-like enzyme